MSFLNPLFLIAAMAAAIPLLIYWLNVRKPRKIRFSTLAFFDSLRQTALKRLKFKRILLLLIRMAAILMLVFAAAKPFLPGGLGSAGGDRQPKAIAILLDNSPSMEQVDRNGLFMDQAKEAATEVVALANNNEDRILLNKTNGESLLLPRISPDGAAARLSSIEIENKGNFLAERIQTMLDQLNESEQSSKWLYIVTDAQETQLNDIFEYEFSGHQDVQIQMITVGDGPQSNTAIEDVELETASLSGGEEASLRVRVRNYGENTARNRFLNFTIEDELISQQAVELEGGESREFHFTVPRVDQPFLSVELELEGDELTFDDRYYAAIQFPQVREVAVIFEPRQQSGFQSYLRPMLEVMSEEQSRFEIEFYTVDELDPEILYNVDAVVMDGLQTLPDYLSQTVLDVIQSGAGALLMPAADADLSSYNKLLAAGNSGRYREVSGSYGSFDVIDRMAVPDTDHPVLQKIFDIDEEERVQLNVPELFYMYLIEPGSGAGSFPILQTRSGQHLVQENRIGNGRLIFSAIGSDPGWSNFPIKPFFAPFFYRTVEFLSSGEGAVINSHTLGSPFQQIINESIEQAEVRKSEETVMAELSQRFDGTRIYYEGKEWLPGFGSIITGQSERLFSVNQNAMESDLKSLDYAELNELIGEKFERANTLKAGNDRENLQADLMNASSVKEFWFWFITAAIILLMLESVVSRFYNIESNP